MESADGEVWEYCTSTLSDVQNAIQQLEKDQLKIENFKSFINKQIETNNTFTNWKPAFNFVKHDEIDRILKQCLSAL